MQHGMAREKGLLSSGIKRVSVASTVTRQKENFCYTAISAIRNRVSHRADARLGKRVGSWAGVQRLLDYEVFSRDKLLQKHFMVGS